MTVPEALGHEIRDAAGGRGLTLTELAKQAGITRATLYNWVDAKRAMPVTGLLAIADVLRMPASELFARAEERVRRAHEV